MELFNTSVFLFVGYARYHTALGWYLVRNFIATAVTAHNLIYVLSLLSPLSNRQSRNRRAVHEDGRNDCFLHICRIGQFVSLAQRGLIDGSWQNAMSVVWSKHAWSTVRITNQLLKSGGYDGSTQFSLCLQVQLRPRNLSSRSQVSQGCLKEHKCVRQSCEKR